MRILIIAPGSRGDVEPYIALGKGLKNDSHPVRLLTHRNFEALVRSHGLDFWPIEGNVQDIVQSDEMRTRLEKGNFMGVMALMAKEAQSGAIQLARGGLAACQGVDLIVAGLGGLFIGHSLAKKFDLPLLQAFYIPFTPTGAYPSFAFSILPPWSGGLANRLSYHITRQIMWQSFRSADKIAREKVLGIPAAPLTGPYRSDRLQDLPILYGYSPTVLPKPSDWPDNIHVTGYWSLEAPTDWTPPKALTEFIDAGAPPLYVGFGSMSNRDPEKTADLVLEALGRTGQRAIMLSGWSGMNKTNLPDSVFMVDNIPFSWLFPRTSAVIHHGGAGTTAAGLKAGIPSIVIPFFADQPFWGQRIARLGVGPEPIPRRKLTVERLTRSIQRVIVDKEIRRRAASIGSKIRAEEGVKNAVTMVQQAADRIEHR